MSAAVIVLEKEEYMRLIHILNFAMILTSSAGKLSAAESLNPACALRQKYTVGILELRQNAALKALELHHVRATFDQSRQESIARLAVDHAIELDRLNDANDQLASDAQNELRFNADVAWAKSALKIAQESDPTAFCPPTTSVAESDLKFKMARAYYERMLEITNLNAKKASDASSKAQENLYEMRQMSPGSIAKWTLEESDATAAMTAILAEIINLKGIEVSKAFAFINQASDFGFMPPKVLGSDKVPNVELISSDMNIVPCAKHSSVDEILAAFSQEQSVPSLEMSSSQDIGMEPIGEPNYPDFGSSPQPK